MNERMPEPFIRRPDVYFPRTGELRPGSPIESPNNLPSADRGVKKYLPGVVLDALVGVGGLVKNLKSSAQNKPTR